MGRHLSHQHAPSIEPSAKVSQEACPCLASLCSKPAREDSAKLFWYLYQALVDVC